MFNLVKVDIKNIYICIIKKYYSKTLLKNYKYLSEILDKNIMKMNRIKNKDERAWNN